MTEFTYFTPTIISDPEWTYTTANGRYRRIGKTIMFDFTIGPVSSEVKTTILLPETKSER